MGLNLVHNQFFNYNLSKPYLQVNKFLPSSNDAEFVNSAVTRVCVCVCYYRRYDTALPRPYPLLTLVGYWSKLTSLHLILIFPLVFWRFALITALSIH